MKQIPLFITSILCCLILMAFFSIDRTHTESIEMGKYSLSLSVKDIAASKNFYQKLGFEAVEGKGSVDQKWIILSNGETKIGLFQGMFPSNTITFNPLDGRTIHTNLKAKGIKPTFEMGFDKTEGPCTFSIADPDGNPILIDQH